LLLVHLSSAKRQVCFFEVAIVKRSAVLLGAALGEDCYLFASSFEQAAGDVGPEGDEFVAFGKLAFEGKGEPKDEGATPFDAFFPQAVDVFLLGDLPGAVALADSYAVGEPTKVVVGEFFFGDDVVEDGVGKVVELHATGGHLVEEVFFFGSYKAIAFAT